MNIKKTKKSQKTRKANHSGCIRKHGSRYEASVYINGKRHYFSAESVAQAKDMINQMLNSVNAASYNKKRMKRSVETMQTFAMNWLYTLSKLSPETQYGHERIVHLYIIPFFWDRIVDSLTTQDIQEFVDVLVLEEKSAKTIKNIISVLSGMLRYAVGKGILPYNPVRDAKMPSVHNIGLTDQFLDVDYYALMNILTNQNVPYSDLYWTALTTGMRRGELLGLTWGDVDFENHTIFIHQQIQYDRQDKQGYYCKTVKSYNSRTVTFSKAVFDRLAKIKTAQDQIRNINQHFNPKNLVFTGKDGDNVKFESLRNAFRKFIKEHPELPQNARFHDMRGSFATHAFDIGIQPKVVSHILGHKSVEFTINRYMRTSNRAQSTAAWQMDIDIQIFSGLNRQEIRSKINDMNMNGGN